MNISPSHKLLYITDGSDLSALFPITSVQAMTTSDADTVLIFTNLNQAGGTPLGDSFSYASIDVTGNSENFLLALGKEIAFGSSAVINCYVCYFACCVSNRHNEHELIRRGFGPFFFLSPFNSI
jgi:hypothetical protein